MRDIKIFDSHFHIIDKNFPLFQTDGFLPKEFKVDEYLKSAKELNIVGGAVVSGSYHGYDQTHLRSALNELGRNYIGVAQLNKSIEDSELIELDKAGVKAVRINIERLGRKTIQGLERFAKRIYELLRWHIELYVDSSYLEELFPLLEKLPAVSIDHLGLRKQGFNNLIKLIDKGVKVKASGFGRVDFDVKTALKQIVSANPDSLMFGTDLPSTRADKRFDKNDIILILDTFDERLSKKILFENALTFYRATNLMSF